MKMIKPYEWCWKMNLTGEYYITDQGEHLEIFEPQLIIAEYIYYSEEEDEWFVQYEDTAHYLDDIEPLEQQICLN